MHNILTDILGLFKRKKFTTEAKDDDVLILGINQEPDMEGIASPVPIKDVKLIKVRDFVDIASCEHRNLPDPRPAGSVGVFIDETTDPVTGECYVNLRSLRSDSLDLTITEEAEEIVFDLNIAESSTDLIKQDYVSTSAYWTQASTNSYAVGSQVGIIGTDLIIPFRGGVGQYAQGTVDASNVIETRKILGAAEVIPIGVTVDTTLYLDIIAGSNVNGITLNWQLYKVSPSDLDNAAPNGTTLTPLASNSVALLESYTSGGVTTFGQQLQFSLSGLTIVEGDYLLLGYNYSGTLAGTDWLQINTKLRT